MANGVVLSKLLISRRAAMKLLHNTEHFTWQFLTRRRPSATAPYAPRGSAGNAEAALAVGAQRRASTALSTAQYFRA
jgi:hypothetical protein